MANSAHGLGLLDPQMIVDGDLMQENKDLTQLENFKKEWEDRKKVVANCTTCDEFLCTKCYYAHLRVKLTKSHNIKKLSIIPQENPTIEMKTRGTQTKRLNATKLPVTPVTSRALKTDKKCKQYTGVHLEFFNELLEGLEGKFLSSYKMSPKDQLCMFYQKLKSNATNTTLSINFGIDVKRIIRWSFFLYILQ